tara:strand:- start:448 stop:1284 length:837 start_codon:yes stop_codon:yes gene_type:complete
MINKKIIISATVKNEAKNLKKFFKIIDDIVFKFEDYFIIFVESDSSDKSSIILKNYLLNRKGKLITCNLNNKFNRIKSLEICRNKYLDHIRNENILLKFDYLFVMDVDGVNNNINYKKIKNSLLIEEDWTAIFPNQKYFYYDIFALRIPNLIEENFIKKIQMDYKIKKFKSLKILFYENLTKFFFVVKSYKNRLIDVDSAFGGLGIYKLNRLVKFKYDSNNGKDCEHVKLNESLKAKFGKLFIDQKLINSHGINKHTLNGLLCSKMNFFANRFYLKIK